MILFLSCDESIFDMTEIVTFRHEFRVISEDGNCSETKLVNLTEENQSFNFYRSTLKEMNLESVTYWIKEHNGDKTQVLDGISVSV